MSIPPKIIAQIISLVFLAVTYLYFFIEYGGG